MRRTALVALLGSALASVWVLARAGRAVRAPHIPEDPYAETDPWPLPEVLTDPALEIEKTRRQLGVLSGGRAVKHYRIALGRSPEGDKERESDGRTPEGTFYVCTRGDTSRHTRALGLSYPAQEDAERGLAQGLISKREYRSIVEAIHRMQKPPWNTALGGEIMIHGGGTDTDWTAGCIALSDKDAFELFDVVPLGTPVEVRP